MLRHIFAFEARYHLKSAVFWLSAAVFFLLAFGAVTTDSVQIGGAIENVNRRWQEAAQRQLEQPRPTAQRVRVAEEEALAVELDEHGHLTAVEFDEDWLDDADVREINDGVLQLATEAYARYEPAQNPADELEAIAREHEILMAGLRRMLTGKAP